MTYQKTAHFLLFFSICQFCLYGQTFIPYFDNGVWGYVNEDNEVVVEPRFQAAEVFTFPQLGKVQENGFWGVIDSTGEYILNPSYDDIPYTSIGSNKGILIKAVKNGKDKFFDLKGRRVRKFQHHMSYTCGKAVFLSCLRSDDSYTNRFVHKREDGKFDLITTWYERIDGKVQTFKSPAGVSADTIYVFGFWAFIEKDNKVAIIHTQEISGTPEQILSNLNFAYEEVDFLPCYYSSASNAFDKHVKVKVDGKWGLIYLEMRNSANPVTVLQPNYLSIKQRVYCCFLVEYNEGLMGYVSGKGREYW